MRSTLKKRSGARPRILQSNIRTVVQLEQEELENRSLKERLGDRVAGFTGSITFIVIHIFWFTSWVLVNSPRISGWRPFDPFLFMLLAFIVSLEAIFLTSFVLMSQNRMSRQADRRAHLDLQINLLTEQETTKILQMLQRICKHIGLQETAQDEEVQQLIARTEPEKLINQLKKKLPNE